MIMSRNSRTHRATLLFTTALGVLALAACNKATAPGQGTAVNAVVAPLAPLPLDPNAPMSAPVDAPLAAALPPAPRVKVAAPRSREARYDYVNRAAGLNRGFADSPPDYAVNYQGERPWVWRAQDGSSRVVESTPEGERYYYYQSGAGRPYLVRDSRYTYGYDQGQLAVVYDSYGRPLPDGALDGQAVLAGQYLARAEALYAAVQQQRHEAAYAANWQARQAAMMQERQAWERQQRQNADWRAWNDQHAADDAAWRREADARRATASVPPPPLYVAPQQARGPNQPATYPPPQVLQPQAQLPRIDPAVQARAQQAQADAARQAQLADQARLSDQTRRQQVQAQLQAQAQAQAQAQTRAADQARQTEQARLADQARRQQAQAQAQAAQQARAAEQGRMADQMRRQQAQSEAARQSQAAARASAQTAAQSAAQQARSAEQAQREQARAAAAKQNEAAAQARATAQADRQHQAEAEAQARAKARQAAADAAPHKPRVDHQDNGAPRNNVTLQP